MNNWIAMSVSELTTRRGGFNGAREQLEETNAAQKQIKIPKCLTATTHPLNPLLDCGDGVSGCSI
jgi:hypothetical protein